MPLVAGSKLTESARAIVLQSFGYRWTVENEKRARAWLRGQEVPTAPLQTDSEWLASHAFHVKPDGSLDGRYGRCEPAYMADQDNQEAESWLLCYNQRLAESEARWQEVQEAMAAFKQEPTEGRQEHAEYLLTRYRLDRKKVRLAAEEYHRFAGVWPVGYLIGG